MKKDFLTENEQYGIQLVDDPSDQRPLNIKAANYKHQFEDLSEEAILKLVREEHDENNTYYIFVDKQSSCDIGLGVLKPKEDYLELGYELLNEYQSQGIGTAIIPMFIDYVRENYDQKIVARVYSDNLASKRILEKVGAEVIATEDNELSVYAEKLSGIIGTDAAKELEDDMNKQYIEVYLLKAQ